MSVTNSFDMIIRLPESGSKIACKYVSSPVLLKIPEMEGNGVKFDVRYVLLLRSIRPLKYFIVQQLKNHHMVLVQVYLQELYMQLI